MGWGGAGQHLVPEDLLSLEGRLAEVVRAEECNTAQCVRMRAETNEWQQYQGKTQVKEASRS